MNSEVNTLPEAPAYASLGKQFISGRWRDGRAGRSLADLDPYKGSEILSIALANREDLDEAYAAAAKAQRIASVDAVKGAVFATIPLDEQIRTGLFHAGQGAAFQRNARVAPVESGESPTTTES